MNNLELGKRIAEYRKKKKLTQSKLAEEMYVTNKTISKWETGVTLPDVISLKKLSQIFGISVDQLLSDEHLEDDNISESKNINKLKLSFKKKIVLIIIIVLMIIIFILILNMSSKNKSKIYNIKSIGENLYLTGNILINNNRFTFILNGIEFKNYDEGNEQMCNIEYLIKLDEKQIYRFGYISKSEAISECIFLNDYLNTININVSEELFFNISDFEDGQLQFIIRYLNLNNEIKEVIEELQVYI